jgi:cysteine-rich repeat protein
MDGTRVLGALCGALFVVSSCAGSEDGGMRYGPPGDAGKILDASADRGGNAGTFGAGGTGGTGSGGTGGRNPRDAGRDRNVRDADSDADNCGDEIVQGNEECDDGNRLPGDGCDDSCRSEPPPPYDTCTGEKVTLMDPGDGSRHGTVTGSTSLLSAEYSATCGGTGKDAVYNLTSDITGRLKIKATSATFNEILYARSSCTNTASTSSMGCAATSAIPGTELLEFGVTAGVTYYVFVDSTTPENGSFALDLSITPARCGNSVVDGGEECDDGGSAPGDGCDTACLLEPAGPRDQCPGEVVLLDDSEPRRAKVTASTINLTHQLTAAAGTPCLLSGTTKDGVFQLTANNDGRLRVTATSNGDVALYVRDNCTSTTAASQLACSNVIAGSGEESISMPVRERVTYYFVVDGAAGKEQSFTLDFTLSNAACGNDVLDGGEECDGRDTPVGYLCGTSCRILRPPHDECPGQPTVLSGSADGPYIATVSESSKYLFDDYVSSTCNTTGRDAVYAVTAPIDGQLEAGVPLSGFDAALYVRSTCESPSTELMCSDQTTGAANERVVAPVFAGNTYYVFVDGNATTEGENYVLDLRLTKAACGDGLLGANEQCDDSNLSNGDGCSSSCVLERPIGNDFCAGQLLPLAPAGGADVAQITATTANLASDFQANCGGVGARDAVYAIQPTITGRLTATLTPHFNAALYARSGCAEGSAQHACSNNADGQGTETLTFPVSAGSTHYLFVDGVTAGGGLSAGTFTLKVVVSPL